MITPVGLRVGDHTWPLQRGINVLYGLNGAGKTTLLKALGTEVGEYGQHELSVTDETHLYIHDSDPFGEVISQRLAALRENPLHSLESRAEALREGAMRTWERVIRRLDLDPYVTYDLVSDELDELLSEGHFCRVLTPRETIWCLVASPSAPAGRRFLERQDNLDAWTQSLIGLEKTAQELAFSLETGLPLASIAWFEQRGVEEGEQDRWYEYLEFLHDEDFWWDNEQRYSWAQMSRAQRCEFGALVLPLETYGRIHSDHGPMLGPGNSLVRIRGLHASKLRSVTSTYCPPPAAQAIESIEEADSLGAQWSGLTTDIAQFIFDASIPRAPLIRLWWRPLASSSRWGDPCEWRVADRQDAPTSSSPSLLNADIADALERWESAVTGTPVPPAGWRQSRTINDLSKAQNRWAHFAAEWALRRLNSPFWSDSWNVAIVDEPEDGLHRSAVRHLAQGIGKIAEQLDLTFIIATHSPEFLNLPGAHVSWVDAGVPHAFDGTSLANLESLGLHVSDLLVMTQAVMLVEGIHDKLLIEHFIGDALQRLGVMVLTLNGGKNLHHALDSQVLFRYTNATLISVLDNIDGPTLKELWSRAVALEAAESPQAAGDWLRANLPGGSKSENVFLQQWLTEAINRGESRRVLPTALSKPDVLDYLHPGDLVPGATHRSWEDLREEWRKATSGAKKPNEFKSWLVKSKKATLQNADIERAAQNMDVVPQDFMELLRTCEGVAEQE